MKQNNIQYQFLLEKIKANNILTSSDIYEIADDDDSLSVFSLFRRLSTLIKEKKIEKVFIEEAHNSILIIEHKTETSDFGFIAKTINKHMETLSQKEIDSIF